VGLVSTADPFGLIGQVLDGQFRVDQFVGEGGFSIVYRGHHLGLDEPIAIKCLKLPSALGSALVESFVRRFRDESRLHYRLSQGNLAIARSIASGTTMSPSTSALVPYMVLEWLEGRSMAQDFEVRRAQGLTGRSLDETVRLLDSAAQGLAYAHAQGVVHRDINPGNLFIATTRHGVQLKVLDFGVAKIVSDHALEMGPRAQTIGQIRIFAPAYGAPEQFDDAMGAIGAQTDVYSFSMILLEALRDLPVREGEHLGEFAVKALDANLPTPRALGIPVGDAVEACFARAVALRASERPADVGELWGNLKHAIRDDAAAGRPSFAHAHALAPSARGGRAPLERSITADMPAAPAIEVTRPGSIAPTAVDPNVRSEVRASAGSRQLHMTVRMESAPPRPAERDAAGGALGTRSRPLAATVPLGAVSPFKSTLVMANRITPLPATARTGDLPPGPGASGSHEVVAPVGWGAHPREPSYSTPGASASQLPVASPAGSAYGPPPGSAYAGPPSPTTLAMMSPDPVAPPSEVVLPKRSRLPLLVGAGVVVLAAAAFGAYRVAASRSATAPSDAPALATGNVPPPGAPGSDPLAAAAPATPTSAVPVSMGIAPTTPADPGSTAPSAPATPAATAEGAIPAVATAHALGAAPASARESAHVTAPASAPIAPQPDVTGLTAPLDPRAFNPVAAKASLDVVDGILASCRHPGGKTGSGHITVVFANDGQVSRAVVDEPPFAGSPEGACVASRMRLARVKAFDGPPGTLVYDFHIPK
jgi:serine/threonine protein kinase